MQENFYKKLPNEILGTFYCYLLSHINKDEQQQPTIYEKIQLMEDIAKQRGITPIELRIIGYWVIQREKNLTKEENAANREETE